MIGKGARQNELTLIRALEHVFKNGGRTVYAVRTASDKLASGSILLVDEKY